MKTRKIALVLAIFLVAVFASILEMGRITAIGEEISLYSTNDDVVANVDVKSYYFDQLSDEEKAMYKKLETSTKDIMNNNDVKLGTIKCNYEYATDKADKVSGKAIWAYQLDNPLSTMWLTKYTRYLQEGQKKGTTDIFISPKDGSYYDFETKEELKHEIAKVQEEVKTFVDGLSGSNGKKFERIFKWLKKD